MSLNDVDDTPFESGQHVSFKSYFNKYLIVEENGTIITKSKNDVSNIESLIFIIENESKENWYSFKSNHSGKYMSRNNSMKFQIIPSTKPSFNIKTRDGMYLTALKNGSIESNRKKANYWEKWHITHASIIKIHIYGIQDCPVYHTAVQIDDIEYFWSNNDRINTCKPSKMENMKELECITKLIDIDISKENILKILDQVCSKWNDDEKCIYHSIKNNCNHFTKDLLKTIGNGADQDLDDKYFNNYQLRKIINYDDENIDNKIMLSTMAQIIKDFVSNNRRNKVIKILERCGINLPIQDRSYFELFWKGLAFGTLFMLLQKAGVDKEFIGKALLGLCWVLPPFISHFFNENVEQFVPRLIIEFHSCCCLAMACYGIYVILVSWNKYQWKYSLSFAFLLMFLSGIYYTIFYSFYVGSSMLCVISMPFCWKYLNDTQVIIQKTRKELNVIIEDEYYNLDHIEKEEIIDQVLDELEKIKKQKKERVQFSTICIVMLCICFLFKIYGGLMYSKSGQILKWSGNELNCDGLENEIICYWMKDEIKLIEYYGIFEYHGFDNMELICTLNEDNLKFMGMEKQGHINKILKYIDNNCEIHKNPQPMSCDDSNFQQI